MKLLIITTNEKNFHLNQFCQELQKYNITHKILVDEKFLTKSYKIFKRRRKAKEFTKNILQYDPDLIILDRITYLGISCINLKIPISVIIRGDFWEEYKTAKELLPKLSIKKISMWRRKKIFNKCVNKSKIVFPISSYLESKIIEKFPNKKTHVLYNSRNENDWYKTNKMKLKHPSIGLLQGANIWKKTKEIITLKQVIKELPNVTFYWAGDGPFRKEIMLQLENFKNFHWLGNLKYPEEVREFLSEIDVYALVSGMDSLGQTILEASLMEKPIIATNVGGVSEILKNNKTGFLVNVGNSNEWKEKILEMLEDKNNAEKLGKNAKQFILKNFTWEQTAKSFVKSLENNNLKTD